MDDASGAVQDDARAAHRNGDWDRAYALFSAARDTSPLSPEDLESLSAAAWWLGRVNDCLEAGEAAFQGYVDADRLRNAAMCAVEMAVSLFLRGEESLGSGWIGRARRLLDGLPEGPEHGYVRYVVEVEGGLERGDLGAVVEAAAEVHRIGREHGDRNLVAVGVLGEGRARLKLGEMAEASALLDEAMVAVRSRDLDPEWAGNVYCHLMAACHEVADIGRARAWTEVTWQWLSELSAAVLFTGICRVHRSQVLQVTGEWDRAEKEAACVLNDLSDIHVASVAEAHYQIGELRRLRGDLDGAAHAYGRARELGRDPQPGLALLWLAQGRAGAAEAAIRAAVRAAATDRIARARLCTVQIEIALAVDDLEAAQRAIAELEDSAAAYGTSGLEAAALHWRGAVALADGHPEEALPALRAACRRWHDVHATYDAARACVLLGKAYGALGDLETAAAELAAATETFDRLGATVDAREVRALTGDRSLPAGLTEREAQVLACVASGKTNREVAEDLVLSEKTIARHLSNIFLKLDVSTRTEAAAFAFAHGLAEAGRDRTRG